MGWNGVWKDKREIKGLLVGIRKEMLKEVSEGEIAGFKVK